MIEAPYDFDRPFPWRYRPLFVGVGVILIIIPFYIFQGFFAEPRLLQGIYFGLLILGLWTVGGGFVYAAIALPGQKWRFDNGQLTVDHQTLLRSWRTVAGHHDIVDTSVVENTRRKRPSTYNVVLKLKDGSTLETRSLPSAKSAERFRQRFMEYLSGS